MRYKNNPLNIRVTKSKWIGMVGSKNGFLEFEDVVYGLRCGMYLLRKTYKRWFGYCTVRKCIETFAPQSDGNDVETYLECIEHFVHIRPDEKVWFMSKDRFCDLISAMCVVESGYVPSRSNLEKAFDLL